MCILTHDRDSIYLVDLALSIQTMGVMILKTPVPRANDLFSVIS